MRFVPNLDLPHSIEATLPKVLSLLSDLVIHPWLADDVEAGAVGFCPYTT
jgi:hypothetical protein